MVSIDSSITIHPHSRSFRKEADYQNALRQQIEENKRRKEEEKRKEEETKRREYEEYMRSRGLPVEPPAGGGKGGGKRPPFRDNDQDSYGSRDDDYGGSNVRNRNAGAPAAKKKGGIPGLDFDPEGDQDSGYDLPPKKNVRQQQGGLGAGGRRGPGRDEDDDDSSFTGGAARRGGRAGVPPLAPRRGAAADDYDDEPPARGVPRGGGAGNIRRGNSFEDDYESSDAGGGRGGGRGAGGRGAAGGRGRVPTAGADDEFVSVEQYDELSKLCDKLLIQQEKLQSEIEQQASLIKVRSAASHSQWWYVSCLDDVRMVDRTCKSLVLVVARELLHQVVKVACWPPLVRGPCDPNRLSNKVEPIRWNVLVALGASMVAVVPSLTMVAVNLRSNLDPVRCMTTRRTKSLCRH